MLQRIKDKIGRSNAALVKTRSIRMRNTRPIVSFSFDDFPKSAAITGRDVLEARGALGTFYLARHFAGQHFDQIEYYDKGDVEALIARGHELGCHTASHCKVSREAGSSVEREVRDNKAYFEEQFGDVRFSTFAYPFGEMSLSSKLRLQRHFAACRSTLPGINYGTADLGALRAHRLYFGQIDSKGVERLIAATVKHCGWLILYSHDVSDTPSPYGCTPDQLANAVDQAQVAGCDVLTVKNALGAIAF